MTVRVSSRHGPAADRAREPILRIDSEVEREVVSHLVDEKGIESYWSRARRLECDSPAYWLLLLRLAEAALLCAGNYADNCEYQAAGDFLVNPREILVYSRGDGGSTIKKRHGRLSEQFGFNGLNQQSMKRFSSSTHLEIIKPPFLPHMAQVLGESGRIARGFLKRLEECQCRIADTLGFLAAWHVSDSAELWRRRQSCSGQQEVADSHLCRFDLKVFHQIGENLRQSLKKTNYWSPFLSDPLLAKTG